MTLQRYSYARPVLLSAVMLVSTMVAGNGFGVARQTIVQINRKFMPAEMSITVGDVLEFHNRDTFIHQIYIDTGGMSFDSTEQPPGQIISVVFPRKGDFPVRCHIHPKMLLVVHVK